MKIISWNCQGAFRRKAEFICAENPDILVIQECENPNNLVFDLTTRIPNRFLWFGDNKNKGVGIFSYCDLKLELYEEYKSEFKIVVPLKVTSTETNFILFAICANNPKEKNSQYVEQVWKAINYYENILTEERIILIGDFNSNQIWDKKHRNGNHTDVVNKLKLNGIESVYHTFFAEEHGKETQPTFYLYRHKDKPYHIDYCFTSNKLTKKLKKVQVGTYEKWRNYSDHSPIIVEIGN